MNTNLYPQRKTIRLHTFDYTQPSAYFITICAAGRRRMFGRAEDGRVVLSETGKIVEACWLEQPEHFPRVEIDAFVIMPDHLHGIISIHGDDGDKADDPATTAGRARRAAPLQLGTVIRTFKSAATRQINARHTMPGQQLWQRGYYEHIIRSEQELNRVRRYIIENPSRWLTGL